MRLPLPPGKFGAYLFDCDGTIADSMPLHYLAWRNALAAWNCQFPEKLFYDWGGYPTAEIVRMLNEKHRLRMPVEDVLQQKERLYFESLPDLKPVPEVLEHIESAYGRIPLAVVSGSTGDSVAASLTALGLMEKFDVFVCAGDYQKGKPDPEPFLLAASRLGVPPESCLVFEDADLGIEAARQQVCPASRFHRRGNGNRFRRFKLSENPKTRFRRARLHEFWGCANAPYFSLPAIAFSCEFHPDSGRHNRRAARPKGSVVKSARG